MANYSDVLAALPAFRNEITRRQQSEMPGVLSPFVARGAFSAFAAPMSNIHAIGAGIRQKQGSYDASEVVLKMFVFDKVDDAASLAADAIGEWQGVPVDVEQLPVQVVRQQRRAGAAAAAAAVAVPPQRLRHRPIVGGLSISPIDAEFVGTLGCFLRRLRPDGDDILVLSNNHVLADVDRLPRGTRIVQPGPEQQLLTPPADAFAALSGAIPIRFPTDPDSPVVNRFDAAVALVTDRTLIATGTMFGGLTYNPSEIVVPVPGMRVAKIGRTTGITHGLVTATSVDGVQVNYGTQIFPRIAVFDNTVEIVSTGDGGPFSLPGDSGSVILEEDTGKPVALLFAGDGVNTTACELGPLCRRLRAFPI